jgi:hypothetical protein
MRYIDFEPEYLPIIESLHIERIPCRPSKNYRILVGDQPYFKLVGAAEVKTFRRYVEAILAIKNILLPQPPPLRWFQHRDRLVDQARASYWAQIREEMEFYANHPRKKPKPRKRKRKNPKPPKRYTRGLLKGSLIVKRKPSIL